jgi:hypothetical protein
MVIFLGGERPLVTVASGIENEMVDGGSLAVSQWKCGMVVFVDKEMKRGDIKKKK